MKEKQKILILYTSVGLGHKIIGENIGYHLEQAGYQVAYHDALRLQAGMLVDVSKAIHWFINTYLPFLWRWLYFSKIIRLVTGPLRLPIASWQSQNILRVIEEYKPALVISTETAPSAVLSYLKKKGRYRGLFAIAFSDFHLHEYWLYPGTDFYLANIAEQKEKMIPLGIKSEKIFVCGMTLKPKLKLDVAKIRSKLGVMPTDKMVIFGSGSLGIGPSAQTLLHQSKAIIDRAKTHGFNVKIFIICGNNLAKMDELTRLNQNPNIRIFGYFQPMSELYAVSDVFISKPGGLSTAEALLWHLPIVVNHILPGQEEANLRYLVPHKLVMNALDNPKLAVTLAVEELQSGEFSKHLQSSKDLLAITDERDLGGKVVRAVASFIDKNS